MARREVVEVADAPKHGDNPIPTCVRIGNLILPSVISGRDPKEPELSDDAEKQITQAFVNMKNIIESAGGTTDNIGKVIVYLSDIKHRKLVNKEWEKMFPRDNDRPARHVVDMPLRGKTVIQLDVIAML
jgi:enamine deaminase RidA (YjgF/YER057c/UK114 family)